MLDNNVDTRDINSNPMNKSPLKIHIFVEELKIDMLHLKMRNE